MLGKDMFMDKTIFTSDILVVGGGIAGLLASITAREAGLDVILADKAAAGKSGSTVMASGQFTFFNEDWGQNAEQVQKLMTEYGENLVDLDWMKVMLEDSYPAFQKIKECGVVFPFTEEHQKEQLKNRSARDPEHPPTLGDMPLRQREVPGKLRAKCLALGVRVMDRYMVRDLISANGRVNGAIGYSVENGEVAVFRAKAVILAGGKNGFRAPGMNIAELTGDPDAMAYRAGAVISGKEFPDMHINIEQDPVWKGNGELYPAYWKFVDGEGKFIPMRGFDLSAASVIHAGRGPIYWDFANAGEADKEAMKRYIKKRGMPMETERVDLGYLRGENVRIIGGAAGGSTSEQSAGVLPQDLWCASSLPGLYAAGDCLASWAWGALDRSGPPGLMPAAVEGIRAAKGAAEYIRTLDHVVVDEEKEEELAAAMLAPLERTTGFDPRWVCQILQNTMLPYFVIHIKHGERLRAALTNVEFLRDHMVPKLLAHDAHEMRLCHETENMILNAEMILRSSLAREESRGWHYREDFPERDDENWLAWVCMKKGPDGMEVFKKPIENLPEPMAPYEKPWLAWDPECLKWTPEKH